MEHLSIYEYLEDWDNADLSDHEWEEAMREAIENYNYEYNTTYKIASTISNYKSWKRDKYKDDY